MTRAERDRPAALAASEASQAKAKRENAKHTPGPWVMDDAQPGDLFRHVLHGNGDSFGYICRISTNGNANADADARLIAAAPLMLDAMGYLASAVRMAMPHLDHLPMAQDTCTEALKWADQVAALAQGDTP